MHHHHLNPYAPLYYPSHFPPPPPPPPPLPPSSHIRTFICYIPVPPPLHAHFLPLLPPTGTHHQPHHNNKAKKETEKQLVWLPKLKHDHDDIKISTSTNSKFLSSSPVVAPNLPIAIPSSVPLHLDFCSAAPEFLMKGTTVMIKNIPNKLTRPLLIEMLDEHCAEQQKRNEEGENKKIVAVAEYDFVYLPIDFSTRANKGYAFVNFTTAEAARTAYEQMHHRKWLLFNSKKVARLSFARVQGRIALVNRFKCTQFNCDSDEYLPATFKPPRNGTTSLPPPDNVGKRIMRFQFK